MRKTGTSVQVIYLHRSQLAKYLKLCIAVCKTTAVNIMSRKYAQIQTKRQVERHKMSRKYAQIQTKRQVERHIMSRKYAQIQTKRQVERHIMRRKYTQIQTERQVERHITLAAGF